MKRKALLGFLLVAALLASAVPASQAFVAVGRSNLSGMFRDLAVCKDGISFDIGTKNDVALLGQPDATPGAQPSGTVSERLLITSVLGQEVPLVAGIPAPLPPGTVLADTFTATPIPNNDPVLNSGAISGATGDLFWISRYAVAWSSPRAAGSKLDAFMVTPATPIAFERLTVANCTLFSGNPCLRPDAILGTQAANTLTGTRFADIICGLGGNDTIRGLTGNDRIYAGKGNDTVYGGKGNDEIHGQVGNDMLFGDNGADVLYGEDGTDRLEGGSGPDTLIGGPGLDVLLGGPGVDTQIQ